MKSLSFLIDTDWIIDHPWALFDEGAVAVLAFAADKIGNATRPAIFYGRHSVSTAMLGSSPCR